MVLKRFLFIVPLLFASCATAPPSAFINNVYALSLGIPNQSGYTIGIDTGSNRITVKSSDNSINDTVTVIKDWSASKALARHVNGAGTTRYINLEIKEGGVYRSEFFPKEEELAESTPCRILYLEKK